MSRCPKCQQDTAEILIESVDIGVGVQEHIIGAECRTCGQMAPCNTCGYWDFQGHAKWCEDMKNLEITGFDLMDTDPKR